MSQVIEKLKIKWGINRTIDVFLIMLVFSLAGLNVTFCRKPIFHILRIDQIHLFWVQVFFYILLIFPIYQISLLLYGFLFGQFGFFWEKQKKLTRFLLKSILKTRTASNK
ncbi:MAG: hypothetical protein A2Z88_04265 [Omnitrophica WOR_2 bacterium GWA2_47_8]|nr:MAG: hypothetical protein A2Z88_04265 [Omnitrophica WOR_2 bacterium GWA2_47_8]